MGKSSDERSAMGTYHRIFVMRFTKRNDGPRPPDFAFRRTWSQGVVTFTPADPQDMPAKAATRPTVSEAMAQTSRAWLDGARTPSAMAEALGITLDAAKKRIQRLQSQGVI
ncbi:MAG: Lrp/AsnC family transcriptional regulator [Chloroflexi bacterium]|nr:Lrp/AsnC family transcriptional regulator [Chloroflexota bacterium]